MNKPIINGLATYGIIRLYNAGKPILAFLLTLLFAGGPYCLLLWLAFAVTLLKPILLLVLGVGGFFATGMYVGNKLQDNLQGWMAAIVYLLFFTVVCIVMNAAFK